MNWSRGLFRLWFLGTALWLAGAGWLWSQNNTYIPERVYFITSQDIDLSGDYRVARVINEKQPIVKDYKGVYVVEGYKARDELALVSKTIELPDRVTLMASLIGSQPLSKDFIKKFSETFGNRSAELRRQRHADNLEFLAGALIPPTVVFVLGFALLWALRGFKRA